MLQNLHTLSSILLVLGLLFSSGQLLSRRRFPALAVSPPRLAEAGPGTARTQPGARESRSGRRPVVEGRQGLRAEVAGDWNLDKLLCFSGL